MDFSKTLSDQAWKRPAREEKKKGRYYEPTFSGALSFCRRPYSEDYKDADIVVTGMPFDSAVSYRPGCRLGPRAIRAASVQLAELTAFPWNFDPFEQLSVIDAGDCYLNQHDPLTVPDAIYNHACKIIDSGAKMLTLGGDHFISYPLLKAHVERYGPLALLQFDAHCDTWDMGGAPLDHGTMMLRAIEEGLILPECSLQVGIRTQNESWHGMEVITAPEIQRRGIDTGLARIRERVGTRPLYVSFDIDCLDPAFAPGTGTPVSGGLASWQALELIRGLEGLNMVGFDLVEVSPPFDHAEITALAAAHIAHDWLAIMARR